MDTIYIMESTIKNDSKYTNREGHTTDEGLAEYARYEWEQVIGGEPFKIVATLVCPSQHPHYSDLRRWNITGASMKNPAKDFEFNMETNSVVALSIMDTGEIWAVGNPGSYRLWKNHK